MFAPIVCGDRAITSRRMMDDAVSDAELDELRRRSAELLKRAAELPERAEEIQAEIDAMHKRSERRVE
jgi:molecular chaperone GrpE (heat shock protein)